jgi:uroporphyrinogen-III decarboxylase
MSVYNLEWGTKEQVINEVKYLIDHCAAGGGYLFNSGAGVENAKRENVEAMFETVETYGRK